MTELALHILDIVQNSIVAKATLIKIYINEDQINDWLTIEIVDNGTGMSEDEATKATDPFVTSRKTRKVGLGLSLFKQAAEQCSGFFILESELGEGTKVKATLQLSHIDRQPLGDIPGTMALLASSNPTIDFVYKHKKNKGEYIFDTRTIKSELGDVSISNPKVTRFMREMIQENLKNN